MTMGKSSYGSKIKKPPKKKKKMSTSNKDKMAKLRSMRRK